MTFGDDLIAGANNQIQENQCIILNAHFLGGLSRHASSPRIPAFASKKAPLANRVFHSLGG
jgi:hypothetical protein